jgi:hypothetical protein
MVSQSLRPDRLVARIRVRERVDRKAETGGPEERLHPFDRIEVDVTPAEKKVRVRECDPEGLSEGREVSGCGKLPALMPFVRLVLTKPLSDLVDLAVRPFGPELEHAIEIETDDDTAEIKEQSRNARRVESSMFSRSSPHTFILVSIQRPRRDRL